MINMFRKAKSLLRDIKVFIFNYLLYLPYILYFNFYYLPLKQAIKLPIWIRVRNINRLKGKVMIDSTEVYTGMIRLGQKHDFYYKKGISYYNNGILIFKGKCLIGNESVIYIRRGSIILGNNFGASSSKFICTERIQIGDHCRVGISSMFMDSDFHSIIDLVSQKYVKPSMPIIIGNNNFFGYQSLVMKGTRTANNCIISARSVLNKKYLVENSVIGNVQGAEIINEGFKRDRFTDNIYLTKSKKLSDIYKDPNECLEVIND